MQVVTPPMDTIPEETESALAAPVTVVTPYDVTAGQHVAHDVTNAQPHRGVYGHSQLNVSSPSHTPVTSPRHARKQRHHGNAGHHGHLAHNLIASLSGIRSTLSLNRGHLENGEWAGLGGVCGAGGWAGLRGLCGAGGWAGLGVVWGGCGAGGWGLVVCAGRVGGWGLEVCVGVWGRRVGLGGVCGAGGWGLEVCAGRVSVGWTGSVGCG